jgi:hypothetical protein
MTTSSDELRRSFALPREGSALVMVERAEDILFCLAKSSDCRWMMKRERETLTKEVLAAVSLNTSQHTRHR